MLCLIWTLFLFSVKLKAKSIASTNLKLGRWFFTVNHLTNATIVAPSVHIVCFNSPMSTILKYISWRTKQVHLCFNLNICIRTLWKYYKITFKRKLMKFIQYWWTILPSTTIHKYIKGVYTIIYKQNGGSLVS